MSNPEKSGTRIQLRASPEIDDEPFEALRILARDLDYGIRNRVEFVPTKAGRDQDDAGVLDVGCDSIVSEREKIDDVGGNDRPASSGRLSKLRTVVELDPAHLVRAHCIDTLVAQEPSDSRRHVLVEVDLHSVVTKRTSPGYRRSIASGVNAALRAISRWISSG